MIFEVEEELKKVCCKCKIEKTLDFFTKQKGRKYGVSGYCIDCLRENARNHYHKHMKINKENPKIFPETTIIKCNTCNEEKLIGQFEKKISSKFGVRSICKSCNKIRLQKWLDKNPNKKKDYGLRIRHKITLKEFEEFSFLQNHVCAICKKTNISGRPLLVDHDHSNNKLRALLCNKCNVGLGQFNDDINLLQGAIEYIKFYKELHS